MSLFGVFVLVVWNALPAWAQVPIIPEPLLSPPVPAENPLTPEKALLGKFLFWEEQLSSDDSTACGTCHQPANGGADPRSFEVDSVHPGADGLFGTDDDVRGSIGIVRQDCGGTLIDDGVFFPDRQVTRRRAPSAIGAAYDSLLFLDGRASGTFADPLTGDVLIPDGAALESQALAPILSSEEMGCVGRTWQDVTDKLATVTPLAFARDLPSDLEVALLTYPAYPQLFELAFGTTEITPARIAFALASYQRTLVPDQTPLDLWLAGQDVLTDDEVQGFLFFADLCSTCHGGQTLSNDDFHNIGVRPASEDLGRGAITGLFEDRGKFRTPSLRNVGLRAPYFHDGSRETLLEVVEFYADGGDFTDNLDPLIQPLSLPAADLERLAAFLDSGLTDPRVAAALPPFDHPTLQVFFRRGDANRDGVFDVSDVVTTLDFLFVTGGPLLCEDAADANDDGVVDVSDPVTMLGRLFQAAPPLPAPGDARGPDPTADGLGCA